MKYLVYIIFLLIVLTGCTTRTQTGRHRVTEIPSSLMGKFTDDYGSSYLITRKVWMQGEKAKYHLLQYNKDGNYFIARNDEANPSDGGLYTRIDIIYFTNMEPWHWGYCYTIYKANTIEEAIQTAAADRVNPRKGCNGFPFSRMKKD